MAASMSMHMPTTATAPSVPRPRPLPPRQAAAAVSPAAHPARHTLVSGSTTTRKTPATAIATDDCRTGPACAARSTSAAAPTSTATLKPLIASTWLMPAARKSIAGRERPGRRTPVVIARTSARVSSPAHAGMLRAMASLQPTLIATIGACHHGGDPCTRTIRECGTAMDPPASRGRSPGFAMPRDGRHHPRTVTRVPRVGSGSSPETRTVTRSTFPIDWPRSSCMANDWLASRGTNADSASPPPSSVRGVVDTMPDRVIGPSGYGLPAASAGRAAFDSAAPDSSMTDATHGRSSHGWRSDTACGIPAASTTASAPRTGSDGHGFVACRTAMAPPNIATAATNASGTRPRSGGSSGGGSTPRT